jgi:CPA1 family monovalent cation:H+ antiporter
MRGVVALAAALSLPQVLNDGRPFPNRNLIVFLTFSVILVTLVLQGLTLPPLIRALGLAGSTGPKCEEEEARRIVLEEAMAHVQKMREEDEEQFRAIYDDIAEHYRHRLLRLTGQFEDGDSTTPEHLRRFHDVTEELLSVERRAAIRLRDQRRISDDVLRTIERELDYTVARRAEAH